MLPENKSCGHPEVSDKAPNHSWGKINHKGHNEKLFVYVVYSEFLDAVVSMLAVQGSFDCA